MTRHLDISASAPNLLDVLRKTGVNHNLQPSDAGRFWGTLETPVRISETRLFHDFSIGAFSYVSGGYLYHTHMGRYCSLSNGLHVGQGNHPTEWLSTHPFQYQRLKFQVGSDFPDRELYEADIEATRPDLMRSVPKPGRTVLGNDVWLAHGVFAVNGITIGDGCIVGSCAVVTKTLEPYSIAVGNPAKVIRKRFEDKTIERLLAVKWWDYAPWQIRHVEFNKIDRALDQLEEMRAGGAPAYQACTIKIER